MRTWILLSIMAMAALSPAVEAASLVCPDPVPVPTVSVSATTSYTGSYTVYVANSLPYFDLQVSVNNGTWTSTGSTNVATEISISNNPIGSYRYRARALLPYFCNPSTSSWSAIATTVVAYPANPGAPAGPGTDYDGAYTISWTAGGGASSYQLQERLNSGSFSTVYNSTGRSTSRSGRSAGSWGYRVRSCNSRWCNPSWSGVRTVSVVLPPAPGAITAPSTIYASSYTASWPAATGATSYKLQRNTGSGWSQIYSGSSRSKALTASVGQTVQLRVQGCSSVGCGSYSAAKTVNARYPTSPSAISGPGTTSTDGYSVSWAASTGADTYQLQRRIGTSGSWSTVQQSSSLSKTFSSQANDAYQHRVAACSAFGCNPTYSSTKTVTVDVLYPPSAPASVVAPHQVSSGAPVTVAWQASTGSPDVYHLQTRENPGAWTDVPLADESLTTADVNSLSTGRHDFQVKACNAAGCSGYSAYGTTFVEPASPAMPTFTDTMTMASVDRDGVFTINVAPVADADAYQIEELDSNDASQTWMLVAATQDTTIQREVNSEGTFSYRASACAQSVCSAPSPVAAITVQYPPGVEPPMAMGPVTSPDSPAFQVGVTNGGDAVITVPLAAPPGVGAMTPNLSLGYSSGGARRVIDAQKQRGVLGYGWSLRGISEIRRCRVGVGGALDLGAPGSTSDRLCFDGQPLVLVSGSYFMDGSEYRTEIQSFVRVVQQGSGGSAWFKVYRPDGGESIYGDAQNSRVIAMGDTLPYLWSESERSDGFGNQMTISYEMDAVYGTNYPKLISYDGSEVRFHYQTRPDTEMLQYGAGDHLATSALRSVALMGISMYANGNIVREYRLGNVVDPNEQYLRLAEIQLCGFSEYGGNPECLGQVQFTWNNHSGLTPEFVSTISQITDAEGRSTYIDYALMNETMPIDYTEAPFGSVVQPSSTAFIADSRCSVKEVRRPDGLGGERITRYAYKGKAHYDVAEGRGFVGYYETRRTEVAVPSVNGPFDRVTYQQNRLEFPFIGRVAQTETMVGDYYGSNQVLARSQIAWNSAALHAGAVTYPYAASQSSWRYEQGSVVSGSETTTSYGFDFANGTITDSDSVTTVGANLTGPTAPGPLWGDVPDWSVSGVVQTVSMHSDMSNFVNPTSDDWRVGFVNRVEVTQDTPSGTPVTTVTTRAPEAATMAVASMTRLPGDSALERTLDLTYDSTGQGNITAATQSGAGFATRTRTFGTYTDDRYPASATNALQQTTTVEYDKRFGAPKHVTDPNGLDTWSTRDPFGRILTREAPDNTVITNSYENCAVGCSAVTWADTAVRVTTTSANTTTQTAPDHRVYLDSAGRQVLDEVEAFDSADGWVRTERHYDAYGRLTMASLPYYSTGGTPQYILYDYDKAGRLISTIRPDGGETNTSYVAGAGQVTVAVTTKIVTPAPASTTRYETKRSIFDALGRLVSTTDADGTADAVTTTYGYDVQGHLATVHVAGIQVADIQYDKAGNRIAFTEPNTGLTSIDVDALGEITQQVDAKGQQTRFSYDLLGRLTQRIDGYGSALEVTNSWVWDDAAGAGRLRERSNGQFTESLTYDSVGRPDTRTTQISVPDFTQAAPSYTVDYAYDGAGRLQSTTYPGGIVISKEYNAFGYPLRVKRGSTVLQEYNAVDAFGHATEESLSDGAMKTWRQSDPLSGRVTQIEAQKIAGGEWIDRLRMKWRTDGALYERADLRSDATSSDDTYERFDYDALDRLIDAETSASSGGAASRILSYDYDAHGNLLTKTSSVATDPQTTGYGYGASNQPHRLTVANVDGVPTTFVYDANGNITRYDAATGDDTFIDYDARNQATSITVGDSAQTLIPTARDEFWYGPDGARFLRKASWDDGGTQSASYIVYLDGGTFEEVHPDHDPLVVYYQKVQATSSALIRREVNADATQSTVVEYLHRDHLGSVVAVTDANGDPLHTLAFDPFGGRRASDWSGAISASELMLVLDDSEKNTSRGYTDHEMLDRTGLVHMNGRVFDARIGRFLQPDPIVSKPLNGQSFNRYAYVWNRPMDFTDPSGFCGTPRDAPSLCNTLDNLQQVAHYTDTGTFNPPSFYSARGNSAPILFGLYAQINAWVEVYLRGSAPADDEGPGPALPGDGSAPSVDPIPDGPSIEPMPDGSGGNIGSDSPAFPFPAPAQQSPAGPGDAFDGLYPSLDPFAGAFVSGAAGGFVATYIVSRNIRHAILGAFVGGFANVVLSQEGVPPAGAAYVGVIAEVVSNGRITGNGAAAVVVGAFLESTLGGNPAARSVVSGTFSGAVAGGSIGGPRGAVAGAAGAATVLSIDYLIYGPAKTSDH